MLHPDSPIPGMHPRQAAVLITVPEDARQAIINRAHLLQNLGGGIFSGALWQAARDLQRFGSVEAMEADDRQLNHAAMASCARSGCGACARDI